VNIFTWKKAKGSPLLISVANGSTRNRASCNKSQLFSCFSSSEDQHIHHIPTAARIQHEDVLDTTFSTFFLGVFVVIDPQGNSLYSEIFQTCPGGLWVAIPLRSHGIPHRSGHPGESHFGRGLSRGSCRHITSVGSLPIPCC